MTVSANLGFPRMGLKRELKRVLEAFWRGKATEENLQEIAKELRLRHWTMQKEAGIDIIPSNDFSFYDHILDMSTMVGAVPARYGHSGGDVSFETYFAMARGLQKDDKDIVAMEMTKWFDTNYHYIVPEFDAGQSFSLSSTKVIDEYIESKEAGFDTRPVLVGPVTYLLLGKMRSGGGEVLDLLPNLLPVYEEVLEKLKNVGASSVQIDEPCLVLDQSSKALASFTSAYKTLGDIDGLNITVATYFGALRDNLDVALNLNVQAIHVDLVRAAEQLDDVLAALPDDKALSVGIVDGRNIWKTDITKALATAQRAVDALGSDRVIVAPSCSLLHTPVDLDDETELDSEVKNWMAFAKQKLNEVVLLKEALNGNKDEAVYAENEKAIESRKTSLRIHNQSVKDRVADIDEVTITRKSSFEQRIQAQHETLNLPLLPTTTIGSFPQIPELRKIRAKFKKGGLPREEYNSYLEKMIDEAMVFQEEIGIDVPVHGEYERNDMVEYFGEKLDGFVFSKNGWVQSYGSRCVKPPIIFGDVFRPKAMTVRWSAYAQSKTDKPVKGMLTGPVTILQWSFIRDDQPREITCKQIALAIRDEVLDLEKANIRVIQIDEPAVREGLPLRRDDWADYLKWAVESFRVSSAGVQDGTQIHTHMCYCEFNDIMESIAALDADVISIETSRSAMEVLDAFIDFKYPNEIGPGVYDIHSPRIPSVEEMEKLLNKALEVLDPGQIWVNPDCGLKTRGWEETKPALANMVQAAKNIRGRLAS
ncbi:MAG: 5-methyltetrahydropteroyltriglutamate--homocysteine S-methyltransferase [Alphaproteobacteria bacterium]|nr:5-methyltetrahydropteroyltriglutamate--homocysteine S-methyltransferase [Alphaproteobacteria bacterium]